MGEFRTNRVSYKVRSLVIIDIAEMNMIFVSRNPTPNAATNLNGLQVPAWLAATRYPLDYLQIGNKNDAHEPPISMERGFLDKRIAFWRNLRAHAPADELTRQYFDRNELWAVNLAVIFNQKMCVCGLLQIENKSYCDSFVMSDSVQHIFAFQWLGYA